MDSEECHILRLPVELLELISNCVRFSDLFSFRQTCKIFEEIAFDDFASHSFGEIYCFFPDPARVKRLYNITSQPHLTQHIRALYLTLDPFEYRDDALNFVAPVHDRGDTLPEYKEASRVETLEYYCSRRPDLSLVTRSLAHLNPLRNHLHVDLGNRHYFYNHIEWAIISQQCLAAVAKAIFPIHNLTILSLTDIREPYPRIEGDHELQNITRLPDMLYCTPLHFDPCDTALSALGLEDVTGSVMPDMHTFPTTPEGTASLDMVFWHRIPWGISGFTPFANAVLSRNQSVSLRQLTLVRVALDDFEPLFHLLEQCRDTLKAILLHEVAIISEVSGQWRKLFELLRIMPNLEHLNLRELWFGRSRAAPPLAILDPTTQYAWSCYEIGRSSMRLALEDIIRNPPRFRSRSDNILALW